ncbi:hypothetical protein LTR20_000860 [Exophiala xenobiotica]|nr:hypothetical protein LTS13_010467 [Exophiala xenobiotica]KAK5396706.1 hypothetical protein LTR79_006434 [Exophiala xenobiotica]KAK5424421.1 hypothetical protein LTR90_000011 [Exophiala xenobiotica]KAK5473400.1 hypothetical protein LTR20_000860 [Exophiala xenobiotica]KAK5508783.1 hypothetical protein LTR07_010596 [Exophiala xenobiotica]
MRFGRQTLSVAGELVQDEPEPRRRNRLSKPLTKKLATSVSTTSFQDPIPPSKNASTPDLRTGGPLSSHPSNAALRQQIRSEVFSSNLESPSKHSKTDSTWSVAYMVKDIEGNSFNDQAPPQDQSPVSPVKPKKRKSLILRRLSTQRSASLKRSTSNGRFDSLKDEAMSASTPSSSIDCIFDSPSIPPTRRASFTPGTATRKPSQVWREEQIEEESVVEETEERRIVDTDYFEWRPPAPPAMVDRAGTPADLDYSHLGGLRHGSLQVMNGRASPAFSETSKVSRQLLSRPTPHRDISSDYGDVDDELQKDVQAVDIRSLHTTPDVSNEGRCFSWESHAEKALRTHPLQIVTSADTEQTLARDPDKASAMAQAYMAELAISPFSEQKSYSSPGSEELPQTSSVSSMHRSPSVQNIRHRYSAVSSHGRSPSPTGSVVWRSGYAQEDGSRPHIFDNVHGQSCDPQSHSCSPRLSIDEGLHSTVNFQAQGSPTRLQPPRAPEKSDSGYSSSTSLSSLQVAPTASNIQAWTSQNASASTLTGPLQQQEIKPRRLSQRPTILKSRKTAPQLPTFVNLVSPVGTSTPTPVAAKSEVSLVKPVKDRKKLQKKRPLSRPPAKVSLTRVCSFEGDGIPSIPHEDRENLRIRAEEVPELEQTYLPLRTLTNQASLSTIDLQRSDIRFPSPAPEQPADMRRSRSLSRPRSWIGRPKEDKLSSRRNSGISQIEAMAIINDFGTVASSLGGSPYDMAHRNVVTEQTMNPYNISTLAPRPRYMMDDKAAAELSRSRSRSNQQRAGLPASPRPSFNDRGGIPGRKLRPASFASDAPPITPEMLQKFRTSSAQRQTSLTHGSAPPPPLHLPRPSYISCEGTFSDMIVAPPPPPHSPRPVDVTPDPWAAHAAAWKARRLSAGAGLRRRSMSSRDPNVHFEGRDNSMHEEPLYPAIPPRNSQYERWTQCIAPAEYPPLQQEPSGGYDDYTRYEPTDYVLPEPAYQPLDHYDTAYMRLSKHNSLVYDNQYPRGRVQEPYEPNHHRPLQATGHHESASRNHMSRPHSQAGSTRSFASSLADELHPSDLERSHPPPEFGRYSGGLAFDYERRNGFGGSAGTRSVSGKAGAAWKEAPIRASFGVDLGDVPVMKGSRVR